MYFSKRVPALAGEGVSSVGKSLARVRSLGLKFQTKKRETPWPASAVLCENQKGRRKDDLCSARMLGRSPWLPIRTIQARVTGGVAAFFHTVFLQQIDYVSSMLPAWSINLLGAREGAGVKCLPRKRHPVFLSARNANKDWVFYPGGSAPGPPGFNALWELFRLSGCQFVPVSNSRAWAWVFRCIKFAGRLARSCRVHKTWQRLISHSSLTFGLAWASRLRFFWPCRLIVSGWPGAVTTSHSCSTFSMLNLRPPQL